MGWVILTVTLIIHGKESLKPFVDILSVWKTDTDLNILDWGMVSVCEMQIGIKSVGGTSDASDGLRILEDRVWPRERACEKFLRNTNLIEYKL